MSENLERFRRDFLNANTWDLRKDDVPFYLLDRLDSGDREIAEGLMIDALSLKDDWPVRGLGHIHSVKALPALYTLLDQSHQTMTVSLAHAIYEISGDIRMTEVVLEEFPKITNEYTLIPSLHLLPIFRDPRVTALLEGYTQDRRYLVVYNATAALGRPTDEVVRRFREINRAQQQKKVEEKAPEKTGKSNRWWQRVFGRR